MLAGCLTFAVRNESGLKVAYYGIRLKNQQHVYHKTFNPELYLYGLNLVKDYVILVKDMVNCVKRIAKGEPAICNFGLNYISPFQCKLLNNMDRVDITIQPEMALLLATQLSTYHRFVDVATDEKEALDYYAANEEEIKETQDEINKLGL